MRFLETRISLSKNKYHEGLLKYLERKILLNLTKKKILPIRMAITDSSKSHINCEIGGLEIDDMNELSEFNKSNNIFQFKKRKYENNKTFNAVFLIPTGIGCEIGGHAGDATPVARLLASSCDNLITHPNVYNASDINEMTNNSLYVEGSIICRLLMGTIGLQPVRSNKILAIIDKNKHKLFENAAVNSINAARTTLGIECSKIIKLNPSIQMKSTYSESKRAVGVIENIDNLFYILEEYKNTYDAVAISSIINVPKSYHMDYFRSEGNMINPWGGVEAMLTHALSYKFNIPSAHSPMFESTEIANLDPDIVDARMAAEAVSTTYFHCILKGLHQSPKIITDKNVFYCHDIISAKDISCLIIPDGCLGLPTIAALEQGIKVIAVKENKNLMNNNLEELPWAKGQFFRVENYWEAVGVLNALKIGISPSVLRRPFNTLKFFDNQNISKTGILKPRNLTGGHSIITDHLTQSH